MQTSSNNKLHKITLIYSLMDDYPEEVSLHTCNVYSYMLCKYNWFNSKGQKYFETQDTIAEGCRVSLSAAKTAIRFLLKHQMIEVTKVPSKQHNKNMYVVKDVYGIYDKTSSSTKHKQPAYNFIEEDDESLPF